MAKVVESDSGSGGSNVLSLESIRESLIRQEDTIVFSLIERAKFPLNSPAFDKSRCLDSGNSYSLTEFFVREIEIVQAKVSSTFPFKLIQSAISILIGCFVKLAETKLLSQFDLGLNYALMKLASACLSRCVITSSLDFGLNLQRKTPTLLHV